MNRPCGRLRRLAARAHVLAHVLPLVLPLAGCAAPPEPAEPAAPPPAPPMLHLDAAAQDLPVSWRGARSAAMRVATLPPARDPRVRLEIGLQVALARAAAEEAGDPGTRVGVHLASAPADLPVTTAELALRILAALHEHGRQWQVADATTGTAVSIDITDRGSAVAEARAVLRVEAPERTRRWPVTATWDGRSWVVEVAGPIAEW